MKWYESFEVVIRYNPRNMPPTSLVGAKRELEEWAKEWTPPPKIRLKAVRKGP